MDTPLTPQDFWDELVHEADEQGMKVVIALVPHDGDTILPAPGDAIQYLTLTSALANASGMLSVLRRSAK